MKKLCLSICLFVGAMHINGQYCTLGGSSSNADSNVESVIFTGVSGSINHVGCPSQIGDVFTYNGIAELQEDEISLTLYPNPSESWIKVGGITKPASFIIYSATGMVMLKGEASSVEGISIENLPIGTYIIKLRIQNTTICRSFIKR
jgi:hypothetical protein